MPEKASEFIVGLIPARLAATRLPGKPLRDIAGWPMIRHVWNQVRKARGIQMVAIATPDPEIIREVEAFGGKALLTSEKHRSGTDRLAEAADQLNLPDDAIVVNIQGDEPLLEPDGIEAVCRLLQDDLELQMASLMCPCPELDLDNPACVKVVTGLEGDALYFSRSRIPHPRTAGAAVMQHVGLYAYRRGFLRTYSRLSPTPLELTEGLEQLRVLEHGVRIRLACVEKAPIGVDTPEDLERVRELLVKRGFSADAGMREG